MASSSCSNSSSSSSSGSVTSPHITSFTIFFFFFLLFTVHTAMGTREMEETLSLAATSRDGRNSMQFSTRRFGAPNVNAISKAKKDKHFYVPPQYRGRFRGHRSPLPWQERIFNAGAHEVPSGPNPISNR